MQTPRRRDGAIDRNEVALIVAVRHRRDSGYCDDVVGPSGTGRWESTIDVPGAAGRPVDALNFYFGRSREISGLSARNWRKYSDLRCAVFI